MILAASPTTLSPCNSGIIFPIKDGFVVFMSFAPIMSLILKAAILSDNSTKTSYESVSIKVLIIFDNDSSEETTTGGSISSPTGILRTELRLS